LKGSPVQPTADLGIYGIISAIKLHWISPPLFSAVSVSNTPQCELNPIDIRFLHLAANLG
jgi:hypothetical protein